MEIKETIYQSKEVEKLVMKINYNKYRYSPMIRVAPGLGNIIPEKYFRRVEE